MTTGDMEAGGMKSCLIVDDSKVIRKVARHILETLEFEVEEAGDGQESLTRCEAKMPDVVLLDWNMPVMSGMEFLSCFASAAMATSRRSCSAPPRTTWRTSARRSKPAPTNM